jgi:hypothetical protein
VTASPPSKRSPAAGAPVAGRGFSSLEVLDDDQFPGGGDQGEVRLVGADEDRPVEQGQGYLLASVDRVDRVDRAGDADPRRSLDSEGCGDLVWLVRSDICRLHV